MMIQKNGSVRSKEAPMDEREGVPCGLIYKLKSVCCGWNRLKKAAGKKKPENILRGYDCNLYDWRKIKRLTWSCNSFPSNPAQFAVKAVSDISEGLYVWKNSC